MMINYFIIKFTYEFIHIVMHKLGVDTNQDPLELIPEKDK